MEIIDNKQAPQNFISCNIGDVIKAGTEFYLVIIPRVLEHGTTVNAINLTSTALTQFGAKHKVIKYSNAHVILNK